MTKKEAFIEFIDYIFKDSDLRFYTEKDDERFQLAKVFWEDFKNNKVKNSGAMTENGKKLLSWMQNNVDAMSNLFTSKEAAEALFTSGRSIAGSMRKLVTDGYVEKAGGYDFNKTPVTYSLTEKGKTYNFDN